MALSQKGARRLVLDGVAYRWRVRRRPAYSQALGWTPLIYAVEHADEPGTVLVVTTGRPHPSSLFGHNAAPVLPSDVAAAIKLALERGWTPTSPGTPSHLRLPEGPAGPS